MGAATTIIDRTVPRAPPLPSLFPLSPRFPLAKTLPSPGISRVRVSSPRGRRGERRPYPSTRPIAARARPVTSRAPLRTVISQSHRRLPTDQPLPRLYLRANDFLPSFLPSFLPLFFYFNRVSCKKKKEEKTGTPCFCTPFQ